MSGQTIAEVCREIFAGSHQGLDLSLAERELVEWGRHGSVNELEHSELRNLAIEVRLDCQRQQNQLRPER